MKYMVICSFLSMMLFAGDDIRSKVFEIAIRTYFSSQGYGKVESFTIDTQTKQMSMDFYPEGEKEKFVLNVRKYEFVKNGKGEVLVLQDLQTNRVWLTRIFSDHMKEGIKIPLQGGMMALPFLLKL